MVQKRSFEPEVNELSSKQPRNARHSEQLASLGFFHGPIALKPNSLGEGEGIPVKRKFTSDEKIDGGCADDVLSSERDREPGIPGSASNSSWATSSTSEEDVKSDGPYHILLSPEHYNLKVARSKLIYSSLIRSPPRKLVPIGPDYQAELPKFFGHRKNKTCYTEETSKADETPKALESYSNDHFSDEDRFAGTCIIPMPKLEAAGCVGTGRGACLCEDAGSIRCIRHHIFEAREKLKKVLGDETFVKLGFYDMGEVVALRWNGEDQELFHDVVFSNPASLGKNFWDILAAEFPSRTRKQIVSYYFNVFMLRRRAEQNRFDPLNIDSDNDEWHAPNESSGDEGKMSDEDEDEDEDSVVESPVYLDDNRLNEIYRDDQMPYKEKNITNETNCSERTARNCDRVYRNGDDNCNGVTPQAHTKADDIKDWQHSVVDNGHDFALEPCSSKEWDVGFFSCPKSKVDLLPTCSMMEEIFGDKDWNYPSRDGHGFS